MAMAPGCERVGIAGSIRRQVPEVKDIEIVAIPKWEEYQVQSGLFTEPTRVNALYGWALAQGVVMWIKSSVPGIEPWTIEPDGKYWRGLLNGTDLKLDLFLCSKENYGVILLIRTGSGTFSETVVTHGKRIGKRVVDGYLRRGKTDQSPVIPMREERDVFEELGLEWVDPRGRSTWSAVREKRSVLKELTQTGDLRT